MTVANEELLHTRSLLADALMTLVKTYSNTLMDTIQDVQFKSIVEMIQAEDPTWRVGSLYFKFNVILIWYQKNSY